MNKTNPGDEVGFLLFRLCCLFHRRLDFKKREETTSTSTTTSFDTCVVGVIVSTEAATPIVAYNTNRKPNLGTTTTGWPCCCN